MKRFYFQFRIMLMTFALGSASVFVFNGSLKYSNEVAVDLPKVNFKPQTIVFSLPKNKSESPIMLSVEKKKVIIPNKDAGAGGGGITFEEATEKIRNKITNRD